MARKIIVLLLLATLAGSGWAAAAGERSEGDIAKVAIGAYRDGFYDVAREELEDFLRRYPSSPYAYQIKLVLYLTYLHLHECQAAARLWPAVDRPAELRQSGFTVAQLLLQLGFCFYRHGDPDDARRWLEKVVAAHPRTAQAALAGFYLGKIDFQAGNCRRAARTLAPLRAGKDAALDQECRRELLYMLALCRYRLADYRRALPLLDDFYRQFGKSLDEETRCFFCQAITDAALKTGDLDRAAAMLDEWLRECPQARAVNDALFALGEARYRRGQWQPAAAPLRRLLSRQEGRPARLRLVYGYLANISLKTGGKKAAIAYLEKLLALEKGRPEARDHLRLLAGLYADQGDWNRCYARLKRYFSLVPPAAAGGKLLHMYARAAAKSGNCPEFCRFMTAGIDLDNLDYGDEQLLAAIRLYAACLEKTGDYRRAFLVFQRLYRHESSREARIVLLAALNRLALRSRQVASLDWVTTQVIENFPLDDAASEQLLQRHPLLVLTVADQFYHREEYNRALPSLLWLQSLPREKTAAMLPKVKLLLAECYWRLHKDELAIPLYEQLLAGDRPAYGELAGLRLLAIYQRLGYREKSERTARRLLAVTRDPALKKRLRRELGAGAKKPDANK